MSQSTLSPTRRQRSSKAFSSMWVSSWQSSTKLRPADRQLPLRIGFGRRSEVRVVRQGRVAAHAVVVLHPALGRQAVVVPADRVEDVLAAHPLVAGDQVGVGVGEHCARRAATPTPWAAGCRC